MLEHYSSSFSLLLQSHAIVITNSKQYCFNSARYAQVQCSLYHDCLTIIVPFKQTPSFSSTVQSIDIRHLTNDIESLIRSHGVYILSQNAPSLMLTVCIYSIFHNHPLLSVGSIYLVQILYINFSILTCVTEKNQFEYIKR